ncbi:hypothetical protein BT96DRAFT_527373 [Gymnopus androsaceus JB14]|uniref:Uncharacterized protein n=1 Tax=Gymnopus androsaceus JB14 TaxID=1447944 RepID=A0A6A4IM33_9AGAR|nr:hypothetical protein BT96DRAFT_527373 [Gymnopus androsaceus JB14]
MTLNRPTMNAVARDQFNVQLLTSPRPRPRTPSTSDDEYEDTSSTLLKAAHRLRKGHKTPLSANFRNMKFEDLYLMGSPFPSPDTTAEDYNWGDDSNDLRVTRSMYSARVMSSPIQMDFTALLYEGPAAHETWSQDFNSYAKARHPNVLQLFGVIDQGPIPALIFFSDLIPLGLFIHQCSPIALCYLQLRWIIDRGQAFRYLNRPVLDEELWMQTQSGLLCAGPIASCKHGILNFLQSITATKAPLFIISKDI